MADINGPIFRGLPCSFSLSAVNVEWHIYKSELTLSDFVSKSRVETAGTFGKSNNIITVFDKECNQWKNKLLQWLRHT